MISRRRFVSTLGAGALVAPVGSDAQSAVEIPRVGLLRPGTPADSADRASVDAFLNGLREAGHVPDQHVRVDSRYAEGQFDRMPALARRLVALPVTAIVTSNPYATRAVRSVTSTIPIVVALDYETDPVMSGWVATIARPGGNLTGIFLDQPEMSAKLLQLLKEAVPGLTKVAVLWDETIARAQFDATEGAAHTVGLALTSFSVRSAADLPRAFDTAARERAGGVVVLTSPLLSLNRARISELALKHRLPGIALFTNFPGNGLLMAYGPHQPNAFRLAAQYVAKILKGARPADLPVQRPDRFELVINLKTAKTLGLTIPQSVLARADHLIE